MTIPVPSTRARSSHNSSRPGQLGIRLLRQIRPPHHPERPPRRHNRYNLHSLDWHLRIGLAVHAASANSHAKS